MRGTARGRWCCAGEGVEADAHPVPGLAFEDPEAVAEMLGDGEICRAAKAHLGVLHGPHPGQGEGPELLPG